MNAAQNLRSSRWFLTVVVLIFVSAIAFGTYYNLHKYHALAYHADFTFYLQFAARLSNPKLPNSFTYNATGFNFIGLVGLEGEYGLHKAIHLEPLKYLFALVPTPLGTALLFSSLYLCPILYYAFIRPHHTWLEKAKTLLFAALFCIYPSTLLALAFDLRPRMLFNAALPLVLLSIHYQRSLREKAALFTLLLFVREESLLFALPLIFFNYLSDLSKNRSRSTRLLAGLWTAYALLTASYFNWTGYTFNPARSLFSQVFASPAVALVLLFGGSFYLLSIYLLQRSPRLFAKLFARFLTAALLLPPLLAQYLLLVQDWYGQKPLDKRLPLAFDLLLHSPHTTILYIITLTLLFLLWDWLKNRKARLAFGAFLALLFTTLAFLTYLALPDIITYYGRPDIRPYSPDYAAEVFSLRDQSAPLETVILTDAITLEAFYDFKDVYVYQRLPLDLAPGDSGVYPANTSILIDLLPQVDYIVVHVDNQEDIEQMLEIANLPFKIISTQPQFTIYSTKSQP